MVPPGGRPICRNPIHFFQKREINPGNCITFHLLYSNLNLKPLTCKASGGAFSSFKFRFKFGLNAAGLSHSEAAQLAKEAAGPRARPSQNPGRMQRGEGTDQQVTWEDQQNINSFNRLNNRLHELEDDVKAKKALLENLDDAGNELILTDEDQIRVKVGDMFFHTEKDDVETVIERETESARSELERLERESNDITLKMGALKEKLYGKFGRDSINLEED